eukprot:TRINITY_DN1464_c0_g1_i4.p1 TRINITY_DN1464_c0_g1~~TRINITY_DN1464_c0_g1_i4.p1  ORF type:complete len:236 (-),score=40.37 TRINITY_DN1464_c0_g1_i4:121-828(-)
MAGKHPLFGNTRSPTVYIPSFAKSATFIFALSLIFLAFFFFFSSHISHQNPNPSSSSLPLFRSPNPNSKPEFSFVASLEKFLTSKSPLLKSTVQIGIDEARDLDRLIGRREDERFYENSVDLSPPVLRVYVYEMPAKFTYDLLWLFRNSYKETSNLTSNGSPVHRLIEQHSVDYWLWADLIAPEPERLLKNVIQVDRQEEADLFYIPFFTTISFFLLEKQQCKALYRVWAHVQGL